MFEKQLTDALNSRLGAFLEGIDEGDVRVGVLNGDVRIRRVRALVVVVVGCACARRR